MKLIKNIIKKLLKLIRLDIKSVISIYESTLFYRLLNAKNTKRLIYNEGYRKRFIVKKVSSINKKKRYKNGGITVGVVWEANGRMSWLEIAAKNTDRNVTYIPRIIFDRVWRYFLREYIAESKVEINLGEYSLERYYKKEYIVVRRQFEEYCREVILLLVEYYSIDVIILPKLNDDWTLDLVSAINKSNTPLLIDDRESAISPVRLKVVPPILKKLLAIDFDILLTHNNVHKEFFIRSGFDEKRIIVNGAPQSDYWGYTHLHKSRTEISPKLDESKFLILFLSFGPRTYMNFYYGDESRDWTQLCKDYHEVLARVIPEYSNKVQVVYKTGSKPMRDSFPGSTSFREEMNEYYNNNTIIEMNSSFSVYDLISNADLILGFQTSGMIEAMFTKKPILYGAWGELFQDIKNTLLPLHKSNALTYSRNKEELEKYLIKYIEDRSENEADTNELNERKKFRENYFYKPDSNVSRRILEYAESLVDQRREAKRAV